MTHDFINGPDPETGEPPLLQWTPYQGKYSVPLDTPLLFEFEEPIQRYQVGEFWKNEVGQVLGRIGGRFHFDCCPIRYVSLDDLLQHVEAPDET